MRIELEPDVVRCCSELLRSRFEQSGVVEGREAKFSFLKNFESLLLVGSSPKRVEQYIDLGICSDKGFICVSVVKFVNHTRGLSELALV